MMREDVETDVAVLGLGAMGSAVLYQLARRGVAAIGIDRFAPPHDLGSTHGGTRITREAIGEGPENVPFVRESHRIWRELEAATGRTLLVQCGGIVIGRAGGTGQFHGRGDFVARTAEVARQFGIVHEMLAGAEIRRRFPHLIGATDADIAYYEPGAGYVRPEECVAAQLDQARALGATVLTGIRAVSITQTGAKVRIETESGTITAGRVVVAAGAWAAKLLGAPFNNLLSVTRQAQHWFPLAPTAPLPTDRPAPAMDFPIFIWAHGTEEADICYGFPPLPKDGQPGEYWFKSAMGQYDVPIDPDEAVRTVAPAEAAAFYANHLQGRFAGVLPDAAASTTCLYTVTPDHRFIIDTHPRIDRVVVISACSGHGFKHSAGIGYAVAARAAGAPSPLDLAPFALSRFAVPV
ncbi:MAG TPA: N-methyl-L-tryptophan oxidase [Acetobacteraceae bacterium]|jgi:sarcosine oxidase